MPLVDFSHQDLEDLRDLLQAVRNLNGPGVYNAPGRISIGRPKPPRRGRGSRPNPDIFAKITAVDVSTGLFTGEQVNPDGSTISGGLTFDGSGSNPPKIKASNNVPWIPVGTVCRVVYGLEAASTPRWWCEGFPVDQTFYVQLSQVAGTNPAYTYQVKADDANTVLDSETSATYLLLGSNIEWTSAPTRGIGKYDAAGGFELLYALGTPDDDECA